MTTFDALLILDRAVLDELRKLDTGTGPSIVTELIQIMLIEIPKHAIAMRAHMTSSDFKAMKALAHSLKSSAGNLGALRLSAVCHAIESESDSKKLADYVMTFEKEAPILCETLRKELR